MKRQSNGVYSVKEPSTDKAEYTYRLWHDCEGYKGRPIARVEMVRAGTFLDPLRGDKIKFKCPYCDFKHTIEKAIF